MQVVVLTANCHCMNVHSCRYCGGVLPHPLLFNNVRLSIFGAEHHMNVIGTIGMRHGDAPPALNVFGILPHRLRGGLITAAAPRLVTSETVDRSGYLREKRS